MTEYVPESITSYQITMAAMHPLAGFGLAKPQTVTVQKLLFVQTRVPYEVKVFEDFTVRCNVYNFESQGFRVSVPRKHSHTQ